MRKRGDVAELSRENSFEAVVLPHLDAAYNLARWLMRDPVAAEDVVQEAMLRALSYFSSFRGVNPRAWLLRIVRNAAWSARERDSRIPLVPIGGQDEEGTIVAEALIAAADDPETALLKIRRDRQVQALVAALPAELREVLVLRELEELSYREIAEITQTPIGTVMSRLFRARRFLARAVLEGETA
jgi:RNA polymerase sigma factor (sigma-70 family)